VGAATLDAMVAEATRELDDPQTWGTTFTLIQAAVRVDR